MRITDNERAVLRAIRDNNFQDACAGTDAVIGNFIWSSSDLLDAPGVTGKKLSAVCASLAKKGLVINGGSDGGDTIALTETGLAAVPFDAPTAEPTPVATDTSAVKSDPAAPSPFVRPRTEKLIALGLAMCGRGRLFSAKKSCNCCGASLADAAPAEKPKRTRRKSKPDAQAMSVAA